jgi:hypothetical protein
VSGASRRKEVLDFPNLTCVAENVCRVADEFERCRLVQVANHGRRRTVGVDPQKRPGVTPMSVAADSLAGLFVFGIFMIISFCCCCLLFVLSCKFFLPQVADVHLLHSATTPFFGGRDVQRLLEDILFAIGLIWMAIMQIVSVIQQCDAPEGFGPKTSESFLQFLTLREGVAR